MRRANLGNNDAGEGPSSGAFRPGTASPSEQRELFETLVNQFMSTGDIQYLEGATQLGSLLVLSDERLLPVLDDLLEAQRAPQPGLSFYPILKDERRDVAPNYRRSNNAAINEAASDINMFCDMYEATEEIDYLVSATGALEGVFDRLPAGELGYIWSRMQDNPDFQGSLRVISEGLDDVSLNNEERRFCQMLLDNLDKGQQAFLENSAIPIQESAFLNQVEEEVSPRLLRDTLLHAQGKQGKPKKHRFHHDRGDAVTKGEWSGDVRNNIADDIESPNAIKLAAVENTEKAIKKLKVEELIASTSTFSFRYAGFQDNVGLGSLEDLQAAIKTVVEAVAAAPTDHPGRALTLMNLGEIYLQRYERLGVPEDLRQAIECSEEAVRAVAVDCPERAAMLNNLGNQYCHKYKRFGVIGDLENAIRCSKKAVAEISKQNYLLDGIGLTNLGTQYLLRYQRLGGGEDLEKSINYCTEAVTVTPIDYLGRGKILCNLGNVYFKRYEKLGVAKDLEQSIKWYDEALAATPMKPERAAVLYNLSNAYCERYKHFGVSEDRERAIRHSEAAILAVGTDDPRRSLMLENWDIVSSATFGGFKTTESFGKATKWAEERLAATPIDHHTRASILKELAAKYRERYERFGVADDLEQGTKRIEESLAATPLDHPGRADLLGALGYQYLLRYERFEVAGDLEQTLKLTAEALAAISTDHYWRPRYLANLSTMLDERYNRFGVVTDLEQAIKYGAESVEATPAGSRHRPSCLIILGRAYSDRYAAYGKIEDLEQAIERLEEAHAQSMSENAARMDEKHRLIMLEHLCVLYGTKYERFWRLEDHQKVMKYGQEAISATPADHPLRAKILFRMALAVSDRYSETKSILGFYHLLRLLYECWHCDMSPPYIRIWGAMLAAEKLASRHMWQESSSLFDDAIKLLPRAGLQLVLEKNDQEYRLSRFSSLAARAASVALQAGEDVAHSLKILELGRGVIMSSVIDCRSDDFDLRSKHPDIYHQFHLLRRQIDLPLHRQLGNDDRTIYEEQRRQRETATQEMEKVLAVVRELPGFERFQLPLHYNELTAMARDGPIVIINCTEFRSDAIMVTSSSIKSLALRRLVYESVEGWMGQMMQLVQGGRRTYEWRNERMKELLLWLWDSTVEPILEALKLDSVISDGALSHIWWIGVGLLAMAPFHAAGDHSPRSTRNTLSRVISSYIPTIKALSYARQRQLKLLSRSDSRLLLISMPTTPKAGALRNAETEVEKVAAIVGQKVHATSLKHPSTAQVIDKLPSCDAVHFACHGVSNTDGSPSESHLLLRNEDGTQDRLSVRAISEMNLENAQIAFLSACSTAQNSSQILADESIYIASAFQLAGFSHVLATQWMSQDAACLEVATEFYRLLFKDEPSEVNDAHRRVSTAFHYAVKKLRDRKLKHPLIWASFIHTGA